MEKIKIDKFEDSYTQFKRNVTESKKLAEEMVAFSNAEGGRIIIGIDDDSTIKGLSDNDILTTIEFSKLNCYDSAQIFEVVLPKIDTLGYISRLNQLIANTANENCKPPVYPLTEIKKYDNKNVIIINIKKGLNRPYSTSTGLYLTKSGSDKRKMSPEELRRLFAESGNLFADEEPLLKTTIKDLNIEMFYRYLEKTDKKVFAEIQADLLSIETVLTNLDLISDGHLTLAGNLLFGLNPQRYCKSFYVDCVYFAGNDVSVSGYIAKEKVEGSFLEVYKQTMNFLKSNLRNVQQEQNFNSPSKLEIPEDVLIEFIVNTLVHRDYYINSSIKVFIFDDRVEIISPGKLPNTLTVEKIKSGISIHRNPILSSISKYILPYSGFGSGIKRAFSIFGEHIVLENDTDKETFKCTIRRKEVIDN